jgi:hypothetical protein
MDYAGNKRPHRKHRGIATLFLTFYTPQGAENLPLTFKYKKCDRRSRSALMKCNTPF